MDLLQKELQRKLQALAKAKAEATGSTGTGTGTSTSTTYSSNKKRKKYMRRSEVRRMEEEEEQEEEQRQQAASKRAKKEEAQAERSSERHTTTPREGNETASSSATSTSTSTSTSISDTATCTKTSAHPPKPTATATAAAAASTKTKKSSLQDTSAKSITHQLRLFGLAIRYFGESHDERVHRLQQALEQQSQTLQGLSEMEEFRLGKGHGIRNQFLEKGDGDATTKHNYVEKKQPKEDDKKKNNNNNNKDDDDDTNTNTKKKSDKDKDNTHEDDPPKKIYKYLKGLLKEWEHDLEERPELEARSVAGRTESKTLKQCKDYIRPLFKLLKQRRLEAGLQTHLVKIVEFAMQGEFVRAHDTYMDLAIGRAAWPIGVTMVGIHARSGRAKIESSKVAHVMNSELQRKYLTSVKRLLSFAQKKRPDVDPSKKVT
jgi:pre-mRNA-splicing factor 18